MADGGKLENFDYSDCLTFIDLLAFHKLYNTRFQSEYSIGFVVNS